MNVDLTRREVLRGSCGTAAATWFASKARDAEAQLHFGRKRISVESDEAQGNNMTQLYANAVMRMNSLPATDRRSWKFQASLHGTFLGFTQCQHGQYYF